VLDQEGRPVCSEMWPGNTTDVKTLIPVVQRLKKRFAITDVCIVADRGMISAKTIEKLEALNWKYILGVRMRNCKEAKTAVLGRSGRYKEVRPPRKKSKDLAPLEVKEVWENDTRYVVCRNPEEAEKEKKIREGILESLREALKRGAKSLVGNKGYRRYLKKPKESFGIDEEKAKEEARYDGKWVLTTNTTLSTEEVALKYKQLWTVEAVFRTMKSLLETRPIFHKCDETIRGHVFCSFLALVLRAELQQRLEAKRDPDEPPLEWADVIRALERLGENDLVVGDKRYTVRTEADDTSVKVFRACGVGLPQVLRQR